MYDCEDDVYKIRELFCGWWMMDEEGWRMVWMMDDGLWMMDDG